MGDWDGCGTVVVGLLAIILIGGLGAALGIDMAEVNVHTAACRDACERRDAGEGAVQGRLCACSEGPVLRMDHGAMWVER